MSRQTIRKPMHHPLGVVGRSGLLHRSPHSSDGDLNHPWLALPRVMRRPHRMSKKTKEVRKRAKEAKKAVKKAKKGDERVDTSSVPPKSPFST
jgi:hypothetical protein